MSGVKEKELQELFASLVVDLRKKIDSGEATGKDKELALKLISDFQIGITPEQAQPLEELGQALPFDEMRPN